MKSVVAIFATRDQAERGAEALRGLGVAPEHVTVLTPATPESQIHSTVETSDTEQPGMGKAVGGVVGGVAGGAAGVGLGAAAANILVPGLGPLLAAELAAGALLGAGGALAGVAAGGALEEKMSHGLPKDELYLYEDALRHGRTVVFALAPDDAEADAARAALQQAGAESIDAARERWWLGIREPEKAHYESAGGEFSESAERSYRKGFETALHSDGRGKPSADVALRTAQRGREISDEEAFRRGYERGSAYAARARGAERPEPAASRPR